MLDYNPDLIAEALDEFRAAEAASPQAPEGAAVVRAKVAHRRRIRVTTFSALGVLLIAVPIAAFAAHPRGNNPPPFTADSPSPLLTPPPPYALFSTQDLAAAGAAVPAGAGWEGCPAKVTQGQLDNRTPAVIAVDAVYTDLDGDSALETAVLVYCQRLYDKPVVQVVGYDRDAAGRPRSLGAIVEPLTPHYIQDLARRDAGGVIATVAVSASPLTGDPAPQQREFAWDGTAFKQVGGPTEFPPRPVTDMSITATPVNLHPAVNGVRGGSVMVTVKNKGPNETDAIEVHLEIAGEVTTIVHLSSLAPGQSRTVEASAAVSAAGTQTKAEISVHSYVTDPAPGDNQVEVAINRL